MAETEFGISLPDVGDTNWSSFLNGTTFEQIDEFLGMYTSVDISGSGTIALTKEQCRSRAIALTGTLTGPRLVTLPRKGFWLIANVTDGAAEVRVSNAANGGDTGSLVIQGAWAATRNFGTVGATVVTHNLIRVNGAAANNFLVADGDSWNTVDAATARAALALGSIATVNSPVPIANGGTGAITALGARANLGLDANNQSATPNAGTNTTVGTPSIDSGFRYSKVENIVTGVGSFQITVTSGGVASNCSFNLPVPLLSAVAASGMAHDVTEGKVVSVTFDASLERAIFSWTPTNSGPHTISFTLAYET